VYPKEKYIWAQIRILHKTENAPSFLFKRNTDVELDLSNDRELSHRADFAEYIPLQEMLQKQSAAIFERR